MQTILNLNVHYGLPLCVSGITYRITLSNEMADHERIRKAMKRQRSQAMEGFHGSQEMGIQVNQERVHEEIKEGEISDGAAHHDFSHTCLACTAKAA